MIDRLIRWIRRRSAAGPPCPRCNVPGVMRDALKVVWDCTVCEGWFNVDRPRVEGCVLYPGTGGVMWKTPEAERRAEEGLRKLGINSPENDFSGSDLK